MYDTCRLLLLLLLLLLFCTVYSLQQGFEKPTKEVVQKVYISRDVEQNIYPSFMEACKIFSPEVLP